MAHSFRAKRALAVASLMVAPAFAYAQADTALGNVVDKFVKLIINPAILLVFALGFAWFMYGMLEFMLNLNKGEASNTGKQHMLWGIIGMLIMVSVYGIITIIDDTFGFGTLQGGGSSTDVSRLNNFSAPANFFGN